jgi:hypothetical protein
MEKHSASFIFILTFLIITSLYSLEIKENNIDSILKIKPEIKYNENLKYQEINKYKDSKDKEIRSSYDFGINVDINKELRTIEGIKIDVGTNF